MSGYFKTIKAVSDIPDEATKIAEYNLKVFAEIEDQLKGKKGGIPLKEFAFNNTFGQLILSLGKLTPVYASLGAVTDEDKKRVEGFLRSILDALLIFYVWVLKNEPSASKVDVSLWDKFAKTQNVNKSLALGAKTPKSKMKTLLANIDNEGIKLLTGLFPRDHIDHFKYRSQLEREDLENLAEVIDNVEYEKTKRDREKYHETRLRKRLIELMTLLPDNESRKKVIDSLNAMIATTDVAGKFTYTGGSMSGGADVNLLPIFETLNDTMNGNRTSMLHDSIKNSLLTLLHGTGLEAKLNSLSSKSGDVSSLVLDGIKTGLLASIAAASSVKELADKVSNPNATYQESITNIAVMSAIAALLKSEGHTAASKNLDAVVKELEERQKANSSLNTQFAISSVLSHLQSSSKIADEVKAEVEKVLKTQNAKPALDPHVALSSVIGVLQSATQDATTKKQVEDLKEEIQGLRDALNTLPKAVPLDVQSTKVAVINALAGSKGVSPDMSAALKEHLSATEKKVAELNRAHSEAIAEKLQEIVLKSQQATDALARATQAVKAASTTPQLNPEKVTLLNEVTDVNINTLKRLTPDQVTKLQSAATTDALQALEAKVDAATTLNQQAVSKLNGVTQDNIATLAQIDASKLATLDRLASRVEGLESQKGVPAADVAALREELQRLQSQGTLTPEQRDQLRQNLDKLTALERRMDAFEEDKKAKAARMLELQEQLVKLMTERNRQAAEGQGGGAPGDAAPQDPIAQAKQFRKDLDEVKKALRSITDAFGGLKGKYNKFHGTLPSENDRNNIKAGKISDSKRVLGMYSYMNEEGRKFIDEVKSVVADKKKELVKAQEGVQKVLDSEPTNPLYLKNGVDMKRIIEGNYDAEGEDAKGVLSVMDSLAGAIQTEYDENFSILKSAAEGIKQEKEYAIREKQQQIAPQYAALNNDSAKNDMMKAAVNKATIALDNAKADLVKAKKARADIDDIYNAALKVAAPGKDVDASISSAKSSIDKDVTQIETFIRNIDDAVKKAIAAKDPAEAQAQASVAAENATKVNSLLTTIQSTLASVPSVSKSNSNADDVIDKYFKKIEESVGKAILKEIVQKLDTVYARKLNPALSTSMSNEPTLFMTLWNNYLSDKDTSGQMVAAKKLTEALEANNLIPTDVLKLSMIDKAIFIFIMIVIRMITLSFVSTLVMKGKLRTLPWALGAFLFIYAIIYVAFVMFVNLDMYRLRIIFNFLNLHGNSANIFLHLILMWLFSLVIFTVMWNLNFPLRGTKIVAISDEEKADLIYRLEVLTMIVWMVLVLMVFIAK